MIYFETTLRDFLAEEAIGYDEGMIEKAALYTAYLLAENQKMNLTAIVDEAEVALKHFGDSLKILNFAAIPHGCRLVDIGSGAGFPGMALKIFRPDLKVTLVDSLTKRCRFLERLCAELDIDDVSVRCGRAEDLGHESTLRDHFDIVTARAVAPLPVLLEYAVPFLDLGGVFLALKGRPEMAESARALAALGSELVKTEAYTLNGEQRTLYTITKTAPTPAKYPRRPGIPEKRPL